MGRREIHFTQGPGQQSNEMDILLPWTGGGGGW